ncbi:MAG: hypothetical protein MJ211_04835 [Bacteroidales bacterium]|nr:hypothetical protein [Bacteroidales bacterium]
MNEKVDINFNKILKTYKIQFSEDYWNRKEFILETKDEYIMFTWSTSA